MRPHLMLYLSLVVAAGLPMETMALPRRQNSPLLGDVLPAQGHVVQEDIKPAARPQPIRTEQPAAKLQPVRVAGDEGPLVQERAGEEGPVVQERAGEEGPVVQERAGEEGPVVQERAGKEGPVVQERAGEEGPVVQERAGEEGPVVQERAGEEGPVVQERAGEEGPVVQEREESDIQEIHPMETKDFGMEAKLPVKEDLMQTDEQVDQEWVQEVPPEVDPAPEDPMPDDYSLGEEQMVAEDLLRVVGPDMVGETMSGEDYLQEGHPEVWAEPEEDVGMEIRADSGADDTGEVPYLGEESEAREEPGEVEDLSPSKGPFLWGEPYTGQGSKAEEGPYRGDEPYQAEGPMAEEGPYRGDEADEDENLQMDESQVKNSYVIGCLQHRGVVIYGVCYRFFRGPKRATDAQLFCKGMHPKGHLASVTSSFIHNHMMALMDKNGGRTRTWIGGLRYLDTGHFIWLDGAHWGYDDWLPGEPNHTAGVENCVELLANGKFNDMPCWDLRAFICSHPV